MISKCFLITVLTFFTFLVSCKKESKTTPVQPISNNSSQNSQGIDAEIYVFKEIYLGNIMPAYEMHSAIFFASAPTSTNIPSVYAGTVSVNGTVLKLDNSNAPGPVYTDTTYNITGSIYQINVSGSSQFPAGTLQYGQNFPIFNDTSLIPHSVQLNSGINIQFNNCITSDSIAVTIDDGNSHSFTKKYGVSNNQLHLIVTPSELSGFIQSNSGSMRFDLVKMTTTAVGTKNYFVILEKRYNKLNIQFN